MANRRSLQSLRTMGSLQVAEDWRDGVRTFIAWWTHATSRVGHGETRTEAILNIPRKISN